MLTTDNKSVLPGLRADLQRTGEFQPDRGRRDRVPGMPGTPGGEAAQYAGQRPGQP